MSESDKHLRRALEAIQQEKGPLAQRLRLLTERENAIRAMLQSDNSAKPEAELTHANPLVELIDRLLVSRDEITNEQVRQAADQEGVPYKDGRSINAILIGMRSRNEAEQTPGGGWRSPLNKSQQIQAAIRMANKAMNE